MRGSRSEKRSRDRPVALVGEKQVARLIDLDITVVVEFQVRSGIEVAQRAALLEDVFGLAQPLDVEFRKIQRLARNGIQRTGSQVDDLVLVPREGEVRRPAEIAPLVRIAERQLDAGIADMPRLKVDGRIGRRRRKRGSNVWFFVSAEYHEAERLMFFHRRASIPTS